MTPDRPAALYVPLVPAPREPGDAAGSTARGSSPRPPVGEGSNGAAGAAPPDEPGPIPLLVPAGPVAGPITDRAELAEWAERLGSRPRPSRSRWTPNGRPVSGTDRGPTWCSCGAPDAGHRAARPDRAGRSERARRAAVAGRSGCCTPRIRTCPAWPRSGSGPVGCSTPNSPAGWPGCPGWASGRWSSRSSACTCARVTARRTGRHARYRTTGWSTRPWTSRC